MDKRAQELSLHLLSHAILDKWDGDLRFVIVTKSRISKANLRLIQVKYSGGTIKKVIRTG
jgi:hypothetical protein